MGYSHSDAQSGLTQYQGCNGDAILHYSPDASQSEGSGFDQHRSYTELHSRYSSASELQSGYPSTSDMMSGYPSTAEMQSVYPSISEMQSGYPSTSEMQSTYPCACGMKSAHPSTSEMQSAFTEGAVGYDGSILQSHDDCLASVGSALSIASHGQSELGGYYPLNEESIDEVKRSAVWGADAMQAMSDTSFMAGQGRVTPGGDAVPYSNAQGTYAPELHEQREESGVQMGQANVQDQAHGSQQQPQVGNATRLQQNISAHHTTVPSCEASYVYPQSQANACQLENGSIMLQSAQGFSDVSQQSYVDPKSIYVDAHSLYTDAQSASVYVDAQSGFVDAQSGSVHVDAHSGYVEGALSTNYPEPSCEAAHAQSHHQRNRSASCTIYDRHSAIPVFTHGTVQPHSNSHAPQYVQRRSYVDNSQSVQQLPALNESTPTAHSGLSGQQSQTCSEGQLACGSQPYGESKPAQIGQNGAHQQAQPAQLTLSSSSQQPQPLSSSSQQQMAASYQDIPSQHGGQPVQLPQQQHLDAQSHAVYSAAAAKAQAQARSQVEETKKAEAKEKALAATQARLC